MYSQTWFETIDRQDILDALDKPMRVDQLAPILRANLLELWVILERMVYDGVLLTDEDSQYQRKEHP